MPFTSIGPWIPPAISVAVVIFGAGKVYGRIAAMDEKYKKANEEDSEKHKDAKDEISELKKEIDKLKMDSLPNLLEKLRQMLYSTDGRTIYMGRSDCSEEREGCSNAIVKSVDALRETIVDFQTAQGLKWEVIQHFVGAVEQAMKTGVFPVKKPVEGP